MLSAQDLYGYAIVKALHLLFPAVQESAIYALLRGLYRDGALASYRGEASAGPPRKYYTLTAAGTARYEAARTEWQDFLSALHQFGLC